MFGKKFFTSCVSFLSIISVVAVTSFVQVDFAYAAALNTLSDVQSSIKVSALSDHTIQFVTPSGLTAGQSIDLVFPGAYTMGTFNVNNVDFATSTSASCAGFSDATLAASPSGQTWGVAQSGQTITITSGTAVIPANRCIQVRIGSNATFGATGVSQIANPASANYYSLLLGGTYGDTGTITTNIINDDAVVLSGTVSQSLTFSISTSTLYFGILSSSGAKFASSTDGSGASTEVIAHTFTVATNAPSGYAITVRGQTMTSMQNAANTINVIGTANASSTPGTEQFGIRATVSGGSGFAITSTYGAASSYGFDATATSSSLFATGSGATAPSTYSLRYVTNIAPLTEAGIYAANLVYVAAANF